MTSARASLDNVEEACSLWHYLESNVKAKSRRCTEFTTICFLFLLSRRFYGSQLITSPLHLCSKSHTLGVTRIETILGKRDDIYWGSLYCAGHSSFTIWLSSVNLEMSPLHSLPKVLFGISYFTIPLAKSRRLRNTFSRTGRYTNSGTVWAKKSQNKQHNVVGRVI